MYVDIHSHIIPNVDDGASDKDTSLEMMKIAALNGTKHIVATPHYIDGNSQTTFSLIVDKCKDLQQLAYEEGIDLTIHSGCEVFISPNLPELYEQKVIGTLGESIYMLIELPMMSIPTYTDAVLYQLQLKGIIPIIAHPERNSEIKKNPDILKDMVKRGILAHVNSGSITGLYGKEVKKVALKFLKMGIVHFIASDAHTTNGRSTNLSRASQIVERFYGREHMENLFIHNGMSILRNEKITSFNEQKLKEDNFLKNRINKIRRAFCRKK